MLQRLPQSPFQTSASRLVRPQNHPRFPSLLRIFLISPTIAYSFALQSSSHPLVPSASKNKEQITSPHLITNPEMSGSKSFQPRTFRGTDLNTSTNLSPTREEKSPRQISPQFQLDWNLISKRGAASALPCFLEEGNCKGKVILEAWTCIILI